MSIFDDAKTLHAALNKRYGDSRFISKSDIPASIENHALAAVVLEDALRAAGAQCTLQYTEDGYYFHITPKASGMVEYPFSTGNTMLESLKKELGQGWAKQSDGTWCKMTDDPMTWHLSSSLFPRDKNGAIDEAIITEIPGEDALLLESGREVGITFPDDATMGEFARTVGFTSPVKAR